MSNKKSHFELSLPAELDLEDVFSYTEEEFGSNQAVKYLLELEDVFVGLAQSPELGRERNEIKEGLRSFPAGSHIVFYRILSEHIRIVRVMHGSRDLPKHF